MQKNIEIIESSFIVENKQNSEIHSDIEMAAAWLARYEDSKATFSNYRKEIDRFLLWLSSNNIDLKLLRHEDLTEFINLLYHPTSEMISKAKRPRDSLEWKPFNKPLAESSVRQAIRIINLMLDWMVAAKYIGSNPMILLKKRSPTSGNAKLTRFLDDFQVASIMASIEEASITSEKKKIQTARDRWIFSLMYLTMMRISEVARMKMSDFYQDRARDGVNRWWLRVKGKGGRIDDIPVTNELMSELSIYRRSMGLQERPSRDDDTPAVVRTGRYGKNSHLTRAALHVIVKNVLARASERLRLLGEDYDAEILSEASAHWMRHAAGSSMGRSGAKINQVREAMRHSSLNSTSIYMHNERDEMHDVMSKVHKIPGNNQPR